MPFIQIVEPEKATGLLRRLYDQAVKRAGDIANVVRLMSPSPPTLQASMELYIATMHRRSKLSRAQREMIAVVVSRANDCYY